MANTRYGLRCSPRCDTVCCGNKPCQTKLKERIKNCVLEATQNASFRINSRQSNSTILSSNQPHVVVPPVPHVPTATLASSSFSNKTNHHLIQLQQTQLIHYLQSHVLLSLSLEHHLCRPLSNNPPSSSSNRTKHWNISTSILPASKPVDTSTLKGGSSKKHTFTAA